MYVQYMVEISQECTVYLCFGEFLSQVQCVVLNNAVFLRSLEE